MIRKLRSILFGTSFFSKKQLYFQLTIYQSLSYWLTNISFCNEAGNAAESRVTPLWNFNMVPFRSQMKKKKSDDMFFCNIQQYFQMSLTQSQKTCWQRGKQHLCCSLMGWACPLHARVSCGRKPGCAGTEEAAAALPHPDGCPKRSLKHLRIHCSIVHVYWGVSVRCCCKILWDGYSSCQSRCLQHCSLSHVLQAQKQM